MKITVSNILLRACYSQELIKYGCCFAIEQVIRYNCRFDAPARERTFLHKSSLKFLKQAYTYLYGKKPPEEGKPWFIRPEDNLVLVSDVHVYGNMPSDEKEPCFIRPDNRQRLFPNVVITHSPMAERMRLLRTAYSLAVKAEHG